MAKINYSAMMMGSLKVGAVAGGAAMVSSDAAFRNVYNGSDKIREYYGDGTGFKALALRMAPGLVVTGTTVALLSSSASKAVMYGALALGGTLIGSLAPVAERQVGARLQEALSSMAEGGPYEIGYGLGDRDRGRLPPAINPTMANRMGRARRSYGGPFEVGGPVAALNVGGPVAGLNISGTSFMEYA